MLVAVTRPRQRARETEQLLRSRGFKPLIVPGVELVPRQGREVKEEIGDIGGYDWLVVTSAFGAELIYSYYGSRLDGLRIAVVGEKTKKAFSRLGVSVDLVPEEFKAEGLLREMLREGIGEQRVLVARASAARELLVRELSRAAEVKDVVLYYSRKPSDSGAMQRLREEALAGNLRAVIFTSPETAKNILGAVGDKSFIDALNNISVIAIAPMTRKVLIQMGVSGVLMPEVYSVEACLELIEEMLRDG